MKNTWIWIVAVALAVSGVIIWWQRTYTTNRALPVPTVDIVLPDARASEIMPAETTDGTTATTGATVHAANASSSISTH